MMAVNQKSARASERQERERRQDRGQARRNVPLDSRQYREGHGEENFEGRRQHLGTEEEMVRRNQRAHLMRLKNRMRGTRR